MKIEIVMAALLLGASAASAQGYVRPYVRSDGTYVQGHHKTAPDYNPHNNYSTQGNYNPYTGQAGTVDPYRQPSYSNSPGYQAPQPQRCGTNRLGQYVCH